LCIKFDEQWPGYTSGDFFTNSSGHPGQHLTLLSLIATSQVAIDSGIFVIRKIGIFAIGTLDVNIETS
jgi:hypothetical protein